MDETSEPTAQGERRRYDNIFGAAPGSAPLAQRVEPPATAAGRAGRGLIRWARTAAITLGVMYLIGWAVAVGGVAALTSRFGQLRFPTNTMERIAGTASAAEYRLAPDPTITPDAAGVALAAMSTDVGPSRSRGRFLMRDVGERPILPWRALPLPANLFGVGSTGFGIPDRTKILPIARRGLTTDQRAALKLVANAPVWRTFDIVARAAAVDIVGGRLVVPFGPGAHYWTMPSSSTSALRGLGYAAVSRAAWHLGEGRVDSAEFALRSLLSVGMVLVESAPTAVDAVGGTALAAMGREALIQLYELTGNPRGAALRAATDAAAKSYRTPDVMTQPLVGSQSEIRERVLSVIRDQALPRAMRIEALLALKTVSCRSFSEVAFGEDKAVAEAVALLQRDVARFPGDRAIVDLYGQPLSVPMPDELLRSAGAPSEMITLVSRLYFNPRIANCILRAGTSGFR